MPPRVRVVVPMKPLSGSKTRLEAQLSPERRALLAGAMLVHVLRVAQGTPGVAAVAVVGGDELVGKICDGAGVDWRQDGGRGLNRCLQGVFRSAAGEGWDATVFVPADLPELAGEDLAALLEAGGNARRLVVAPDRAGEGTNALHVPAGVLLKPMMGPGSFRRHLGQAAHRGIPVEICGSPGFLLDIDTGADLDLLLAHQPRWWEEAERRVVALGLDAELRIPRAGARKG